MQLPSPGDAVDLLERQILRWRYQLRQRGLALALAPALRAWHFVLEPSWGTPDRPTRDIFWHRFGELLAADVDNVERGYYPAEALDMSLGDYLKLLPTSPLEAARVWWRRRGNNYQDLPDSADDERYPAYYLRNFHWQTDGWLSHHSARLYDASVEFLFFGTADVLRRMAIPPLVDALRGVDGARVLDVGCGTGRFLLHLSRALPRARLYGVDLSPHYLARAREVLREAPCVSLVAENAEALPFADATFDAVSSVFLFHELPASARQNVLREAWRVLEPGGSLVICDAAQPPASDPLEHFFSAFSRLYHEPYFRSYLEHDLAESLEQAGFTVTARRPWFWAQVVVGEKPRH